MRFALGLSETSARTPVKKASQQLVRTYVTSTETFEAVAAPQTRAPPGFKLSMQPMYAKDVPMMHVLIAANQAIGLLVFTSVVQTETLLVAPVNPFPALAACNSTTRRRAALVVLILNACTSVSRATHDKEVIFVNHTVRLKVESA